jgi:hypothetical protein
MSNFNVIKFTTIDSVNSGYQNTSGWFKKKQSSNSPSNREVDRHLILRVKNVDDINAVSGVIRFNEEKVGGPVFEGYDGIQWSSFNNVQALNGVDGLNYKTIVQGENLVNTNDTNINYHSIFKNITTTVTNDSSVDTDTDSGTDSQITATIHKTPTFKYDSNFTNKQFNLSNHNVIFEPNDLTSYKVYVNKNESWPPVDYSQHSKYSQLNNGVKLASNSYIARNIKPNFKLYNQEYDTVYINQNGYLTFGVGESAFVQNLLQNHFSKYRISALFLNLKDDETSGSSSTYTTSDSDIFVGTGKYGEYVITFQNYKHNPGTVNYRVDFQIRLFLSGPPTDTNSLYSDDYYPPGTIQIAYNNNSNLINISPVVGISDSSGYDATNFTELYFSNLLTNTKRVATTETGIPFLRTFLHLQVNHDDSTSISNLNTKHTSTNTASNKQINSSGVSKFKLVLNDLDSNLITINDTTYGTSYQEDNYYIKTIDLGNVLVQKLSVAIRSDFDYEPTKNNSVVHYSDSTNYFVDKDGTSLIKNNTLETGTNWLSIPADKFIDLPAKGVYSTTNNKDYFNIYDNMASNDNHTNGIYNSTIYRIQARYQKQMDMSTTTPTLTNNLILKIIYTLNSDIDNNTGINLSNALAINFNRTTAGDNYGPYHYIKNDTDLFSITRTGTINASARFVARIYDHNMTAETSQISTSNEVTRSRTLARRIDGDPTYSNNSLTLELLDSSGSTLDTNKPTDTKLAGEVKYQNLKFFNQITKSDPSLTEQYYLKITGTHNLGYYGISLIESIQASSETQVSGVYSNHKFSRITGDGQADTEPSLPLTITNSTITSSQRIYSITKSDNLLFLISDSSTQKMRFYNYSFSGAIKDPAFITAGVNGVPYSNYNDGQEVLDMQFMGDKVLVARKNGTNINIDIFDFDISGALAPSTLTSTSSAPNINKVYMRVLTTPAIDDIPAINYGLIAYIEEGGQSYLNLYNFKEGDATLLTNTISGLTGAHVLDNIVNFLVFDKDNIFLIGNKGVTTPSGEIIKLSYDTTQTPPIFLQVGTTTVARTSSGITVNKILYAEKYESGSDKYIVVFYQEGTDAATGYCMTIYTLDFSTQYDQIFEYDGSRVTTLDNIIFNFKVKYSMILILWQDTSSIRYFQSYKIQLTDTTNPILKKKTSSAYSSTDFLMDVVLHNITLNSQSENIYVIIRKYLGAEDGTAFQLLIQIQKEDTNNVIIQFNSTTNYMKDLDFAYGGKSIFNSSSIVGERNFEITNGFNKLIKDPLPIIDTVNDEQLFFFGFDNTSKKLILEGFGKLSDVTNTGATITASNEIVTIGASEDNDGSSQLAIADISLVSNFATTTTTYSDTVVLLEQRTSEKTASFLQPKEVHKHLGLLDSGQKFYKTDADAMLSWPNHSEVDARKDYVIRMETSLNTIIKTIDGTQTFFTGVLHGPLSLEFINSPYPYAGGSNNYAQRFLMGVRGTFKFDIYSGNSYVQQNQFTITAVIGNYQMDDGENLKVIKFKDGFLIFYIDWDTNITGHILKIEKFVVSTSGVWTRTTKEVIFGTVSSTSSIMLDTRYTYSSTVDWPYIAIRHFMVDDGDTMFLSLICPYRVDAEGVKIKKWIGVRMEDLTIGSDWGWAPTAGSVVTSGSPFHWYLLYLPVFSIQGSIPDTQVTLDNFVDGGSYGPKTYQNTMIHIKWSNDKKYIYFLNKFSDKAYDGGSQSGNMILIRCEQDGTDEPAAGWTTIEPGSSYFRDGKLDLNFLNFETTQVEGISFGHPIFDTDQHLYSQNLVYKNTNTNKIHIYFMLMKGIEFIKYKGSYLANYPITQYVLSSSNNDVDFKALSFKDFSYNRIARLTINFDDTASNETYEISDSYAARSTPNINNSGTAATNGPILEKETLINGLHNGNFSHFKMIVDSGSRYIIAGSNYTKSNIYVGDEYSSYVNIFTKIDREVLDFIVYKVKEDGDLILVCYGFNQRILSIHIENSNLVLFVPANTSGVFASDGKFTKVFKKPIADINTQLEGTTPSDGATEIDLASFSPTIIEPENDTNNKLNYPQFFTNLNMGSNIVYNGGLHYNSDENMYQDNAPFENQAKNLKYNMIVGYSPSPDGSAIAYGDDKSFGISSFGLFTSIAATEEEEEEEESGSTTTTDTSIAGKLLHFNTQLGNSTDSSFVTGRYRNSTFNTNEDDTGVIFYSYNNPISITTDTANFYVRTNSIPNYEPIYAGNVIKGSWNNELSDNTNANYSIMPQNYGWLTPNTLTENGKYFKIPHTITNVSTKSILVGSTNISETFWYIGDSGWDAIMVNPGYYDSTATQNTDSAGYYITNSSLVTTNVNDKLFTPLGRIGVSVNGVVFYNFSNLERNKNAVEDLKPDIFGGMGDSLYAYHYHTWPVNLEGMLDLGHPDPSIQGSDYGRLPTLSTTSVGSGQSLNVAADLLALTGSVTYPKYIYGMTYYFNQIDRSNYDSTTVNKFAIKFEPVFKGTIHRFKVRQFYSEYYLTPIDYSGTTTGSETRRLVISKIKQGDTIIFNHDATCTRLITITSREIDPGTGDAWPDYATLNTASQKTFTYEDLTTTSSVNVVSSSGNKYVFNGSSSYDINKLYLVQNGTYTINNIPSTHPIAILNNGKESNIAYSAVDNTNTPIVIKVSGGTATADTYGDYFTFTDSGGSPLQLANGTFKFMRGRTYKFEANGISSGYIFHVRYNNTNSAALTGTGSSRLITIPIDQASGLANFNYHGLTHNGGAIDAELHLLKKTVTESGENTAEYDFYYGSITLNVTGNFSAVSVYCYNHGFMGEQNLLVYDGGTSVDILKLNNHGFTTGDEIVYSITSGSTVLTNLVNNTNYFAIRVDDHTLKIALTSENSHNGIAISVIPQMGTHTLDSIVSIKSNTLTQISTAGNDGALTYFNVPYNFDLGFLRYQPSGTITQFPDWGSYIITGSFYEYNVALAGTSTEKYYTLTPEGGTTIAGTTSPALTNIKFGDLVLFDQPEVDSTYDLKIKTGSATDSDTDPDNSGLFFQNTSLHFITFDAADAGGVHGGAQTGNIQINSHGLSTDDPVTYRTEVNWLSSHDVNITTIYIFYIIRVDANNIKLAISPGGAAVTFYAVGPGTHALSDIKYLYLSPKSDSSLAKTKLYYTTGADVTDVEVTGGSISLATYSRPTEYSFNNTLIRHGTPGNSYCPYTKFTIPNFSDIKVNRLALTLNSNKYEIYGNLTHNRYTLIQKNNIYVKLDVKQTYTVTAADVNIINNTINIEEHGYNTGNILTYNQGTTKIDGLVNNRNYYVINIDINTIKLATSEGLANVETNINFTTTGTGTQTFKIVDVPQRYKFYGKYNNTGYYETSSTEKITDLQLFNGTQYIFDVSDSSMSGITLRFSSSNTTFTEELSYSTANDKITTDITGIENNTLLYAFNSSDATNTNILGSTIITVKTAHSQFLTEFKLFRDTRYIIDVSLLATSQLPKFSTTLPSVSFEPANVNTTSNTITISSHSFSAGDNVTYIKGTTEIGGLTNNTEYFIINTTTNTIQLATTVSGSAISLTGIGTGSQTLRKIKVYNFPYYGADTFIHNTTTNLINFTVGDDINSLYIYNSEDTSIVSNLTMGSNYGGNIYSEKIYDLLNEIRVTDLSLDSTGDSGSGINSKEVISNIINVTITGSKFEFYATDQSIDNNHKFDFYVESTTNNITTLKLYNNTKYIIKYFDTMKHTDNILKFTSNETPANYAANNITFDDTYDDSIANQISFVVKGLSSKTQTIYVYNGKSGEEAVDMTGNVTTTIQAQNPKPINIYTDVNSAKLRFFRNPTTKDYFNGFLDYENAENYITKKLTRTGAPGHSPLLGYAFDGHPIYGPLGYNKDDSDVVSATTLAAQASFNVKLMKSSYTGGNDNDGNPTYIQSSGDLDICNGITLPTPEFPKGIYHYVCTIELKIDGSPKLSTDSNYGYLNEPNTIVKATYPYVIGAYKGLPEKSNFNTTSTTTTLSAASSQITTYKMNFKSIKAENNKFNGSNFQSLDIYSDDNYINMCSRTQPYIWNFTNEQNEDSFFGKANKDYGSTISSLRSLTTDTKFKAYGNVSKWICKENISAGLAVRLVNNTRNITVDGVVTSITTLEVELYDSRTSPNERNIGAAFLGIALNDTTTGNSCFVCTKGITTVKIGKSLGTGVKCGSYGTLVFSTLKGYIIGLGETDVISSDVAIAGYFLEDLSSVAFDQLVLFQVQGNYEFN